MVYPFLTNLEINMCAMLYMIAYIPVNFIANYLIDKYGSRLGLIIGCVLTIAGLWVKILIGSGFEYVLIG